MNKNDWQRSATPAKVDIVCESNGKIISADVLSLNEQMLVAAISGVKVTLVSRSQNGVYQGRMAGLDLVYTNRR
jgi:hypothetical protein